MNAFCAAVNLDAFVRFRASPSQENLARNSSLKRSRLQGVEQRGSGPGAMLLRSAGRARQLCRQRRANLRGVIYALRTVSLAADAPTRDRLDSLLPNARFVNLHVISNRIRAVKDRGQIARITRAAQIADQAMAAITADLRPGMRPRDATAIAAQHYLSHRADDHWVGPVSISRWGGSGGCGMGFFHATFSGERPTSGDILHGELVPRVSYYSARFMRSGSIGVLIPADVATMARLAVLRDAQFAAIHPGARGADGAGTVSAPQAAPKQRIGCRAELPQTPTSGREMRGATPVGFATGPALAPDLRTGCARQPPVSTRHRHAGSPRATARPRR